MGRPSNAKQRRQQIIRALYDCLAIKGHEKVTIKGIAAQAGLPPGVIHYYFSSKDEIVSQLAEAIVDKYSTLLNRKVNEAIGIAGKIESLIDLMIEFIFNRALNRVFYNLIQMAFERTELQIVMKKLLTNYRETVAEVFKEAGAGVQSPFLGAALVAITEGLSVQLMVDPDAFKEKDIRQLISKAVRDRLN